MKIYTQLFLVFLFTFKAAGQQTEFGISLNSGLFSFRGPSSEKVTFLNVSQSSVATKYYTNNPYGSNYGLLYGISINLQHITKKNIIFGISFGYENLRSKISIDHISFNSNGDLGIFNIAAIGKIVLSHHFSNLVPYIGYRIKLKKFSLDLSAGSDLAYCIFAYERGSTKSEFGNKYKTSKNRSTIRFDFRPRIQSTIQYKKYGLYAAYSIGLVNYKSDYVGGVNECYSRMFRFGLTYKL